MLAKIAERPKGMAAVDGGGIQQMQDDGEQWREGSGTADASSMHTIPLFAQALSLLTSFPTPPHDAFYTNPHPPLKAKEEEDRPRCKMRSKNWTRLEMMRLIRLRSAAEVRFASSGKKMELWDEIAGCLKREGISRDGQQCRDKWEKLCASYKDVREGSKMPEDFLFYNDLHPLLSGKHCRKNMTDNHQLQQHQQRQQQQQEQQQQQQQHQQQQHSVRLDSNEGSSQDDDADEVVAAEEEEEEDDEASEEEEEGDGESDGDGDVDKERMKKKKKKKLKYVAVTEVAAVEKLMESVVSKQQVIFREFIESMERREQAKEEKRQEREDKWRAEERIHTNSFNNAMLSLANKLTQHQPHHLPQQQQQQQPQLTHASTHFPKRRSKNWKRAEVLQLINLRRDMEIQFATGARRTAVWEDLAGMLIGDVRRDGKQCREKWDKLMAAYKDVVDGKREEADLPYFPELSSAFSKQPVTTVTGSIDVTCSMVTGMDLFVTG